MKELLEEIISLLVNQPLNAHYKIKQKTFVTSVKAFLTSTKIPDILKEHVDLINELITLHEKYRSLEGNFLVSSINISKYPSLMQLVAEQSTKELSYDRIHELSEYLDIIASSVNIKQKSTKIIEELSKLDELSDQEVVEKYKKIITSEYIKLINNRDIKESIEIDPNNTEVLTDVITILTEESKSVLKIPTNIPILDEAYLDGGFEEGRVYLFASSPGLGKSTLIINLVLNMAKNVLPKKILKSDKPPAIVYYTLENNLTETYERFSRVLLGEPIRMKDITDSKLEELVQKFGSLKTKLIIRYMRPGSKISDFILDISAISETNRIVSIFVDYLDLFTYDLAKVKERRHELGAITFTLKILGIMHKCPVISPTQINTEGYFNEFESDKPKIPTMRNVDESRQKAQNADFVCLMFNVPKKYLDTKLQFQYADDNYKLIGLNIDKNRDGSRGVIFAIGDFSIYSYKFLDGTQNSIILSKLFKK